jgi:hypothetical protein
MACAMLCSAAGIASCGSEMPSDAAIEVHGHVISKAQFAHWMSVTAIRDYELLPRGPVPKWVLPDPPNYAVCIAHIQAEAAKASSSQAAASKTAASASAPNSGAPSDSPKAQCQRRYGEIRRQVLNSLTTGEWLISEGEELGKATPKQIKAHFEEVKKNLFASDAAFRSYLAYTGETIADQLFRAEIKVYSAKLQERIRAQLKSGAVSQQALARKAAKFPSKWAAQTNCSPEYVLPNCKQYRGSGAPVNELL